MPIYNVILSTSIDVSAQIGPFLKPIQSTPLTDVRWLVNWGGLFGNDADKYKKCRLRYELISDSNGGLTTTACNGFLTLVGIGTSHQASNFPSTFLGLTTIEQAPGTSVFRVFRSNLADVHGIDVNIPTSIGELGIRFYNEDGITLQGSMVNYMCQLQFELYNE